MTTDAIVLLIHAFSAAVAGVVYSLWAYKWIGYRRPWLVALNVALAAAAYLFAVWFTFGLLQLPRSILRSGVGGAIPLLLLGPAIVRFLELQVAERSEAFAREVKSGLNEDT